ncbi:hypothetical protein MBLNU457_5703t2 [Dothideomycetes sp. NU457]
MRVTAVLRQYTVRLTLFTRKNCSLCDDAKKVLSNVWDRRPFEYDEIDVMEPPHEKWKGIYEFDTPVTKENNYNFSTTAEAAKLMHRFKEDQVEKLMDETMMKPID